MSSSMEAKICVLGSQGKALISFNKIFAYHSRSRQDFPRIPLRQRNLQPRYNYINRRRVIPYQASAGC